MTLHPIIRPFGLFIGILGISQGLVWIILSILALLINNEILKVEENTNNKETYMQAVKQHIFIILSGDKDEIFKLTLGKNSFLGFSILYLFLSLIWLGVSSYLFWELFHSKCRRTKSFMLAWTIITITVSFVDLILFILLASDLDAIIKNGDYTIITKSIYVVPLGVVMTVVARGYVLLIINIISAALSLVLWKSDNKKLQPDNNALYSQNIAAYDENRNPPWNFERQISLEHPKPEPTAPNPIQWNNPWSIHRPQTNISSQQSERKESTNNNPNGWFVEVANENTYAKPNNSFVNPMFVNDHERSATRKADKRPVPSYKSDRESYQEEEKYASIGRRGRKPLALSIPPPNVPPTIPAPDYERNTPPVNQRTPSLRPVLRSNNIY